MFTWECPKCGRELDVSETECPHCSGGASEASKAAATASPPPPAQERVESQTAAAPPPPAESQPPARPKLPPRPRRRTPAQLAISDLRPVHLVMIVVVLILAIGSGVYLARPELFRSSELSPLENIPDLLGTASGGSASWEDLQIAGIRTFYDSDYQPQVRAVIINHGESPRKNVDLTVELRPTGASLDNSPLASFTIQLEEELGPQESREIETSLQSLGTLASIPKWDEIRIEVAPRSAQTTAVENP